MLAPLLLPIAAAAVVLVLMRPHPNG